MKLKKIKMCLSQILALHEKNTIFQLKDQRKVKICIYLYLFHDWFPWKFVFICSIYLIELIKRR